MVLTMIAVVQKVLNLLDFVIPNPGLHPGQALFRNLITFGLGDPEISLSPEWVIQRMTFLTAPDVRRYLTSCIRPADHTGFRHHRYPDISIEL
jgi:hypothetical protein